MLIDLEALTRECTSRPEKHSGIAATALASDVTLYTHRLPPDVRKGPPPARTESVHRLGERLGDWTLSISDRHKSKNARRAMRIIGSAELGTFRAM